MDELQASLTLYEEKYIRLYRAHEKIQQLNQCLEEKLLNLAETHHEETLHFSSQIDNLTQGLVEARIYIHQLEDENDRYRNDINAVVQLLQCKPSSFVSPKIGMLPEDLQRKALGQMNGTGSIKSEKKIIKVQVPSSLPQMDIMYAVDKGRNKRSENDIVSAAIIATILQEREKERNENHSSRCHCGLRNIRLPTHSVQTQTLPSCTIFYSGFTGPESQKGGGQKDIDSHDKQKQHISELKESTKNTNPSALLASNLQVLSSLSSPPFVRSETSKAHRPNSLKLSQPQHKKLTTNSTREKDRHNGQPSESHWSTTVLVQHPPRRSESYRSNPGDDFKKNVSYTPLSQEVDSDESHQSPSSTTPPVNNSSSKCRQQYYRAQKRSFWTRSSSTTSTETEI